MRPRVLALVALCVALALALAPVVVAAATDSQVISVLGRVIEGIIAAGRDAYCAFGVTVFCP